MPLFHQSISSGTVFVKMLFRRTSLLLLLFPLQLVSAAPSVASDVERQPLNITAIVMFVLFVAATIAISVWAAKRTQSSSDFYNAGGNLTGLQNGTAIAGDFMSAASFLGITGLVFAFGFDGLIFAVGAFAGWPIMLFLFAKHIS
jgi:cation/acetate symporter